MIGWRLAAGDRPSVHSEGWRMTELTNHELVPDYSFTSIRYEERPVHGRKGDVIDGLHQVWIWLDNEAQLNSYTTQAVKDLILAFRRASNDRRAVAVVFTAVGTRAFCTGGNTAEYATYYAGRPLEYAQYMRLFNDMVTSILLCDKPVICRVNGMRIAGGQEIGMACDFTVAADHARFGQAGPVHGSAPDGGSTDFLDIYVGYAKAAESLVLCEPWSAHKAVRLGLINDTVAVHKTPEGQVVADPTVITDRFVDDAGRIVHGEWKTGAALDEAKALAKRCTIDLAPLDHAVDRLVTKLLHTFPDCTRKTLESLRKKKLESWYRNSETNRSWLALNMNTEAAAGFPAFHYGERAEREIDFALLRRRYAEGARFDRTLIEEVLLPSARAGLKKAEGE
jgi:6-oxo-cyclohex-1-ene-carbonyl-CoA hydrolase